MDVGSPEPTGKRFPELDLNCKAGDEDEDHVEEQGATLCASPPDDNGNSDKKVQDSEQHFSNPTEPPDALRVSPQLQVDRASPHHADDIRVLQRPLEGIRVSPSVVDASNNGVFALDEGGHYPDNSRVSELQGLGSSSSPFVQQPPLSPIMDELAASPQEIKDETLSHGRKASPGAGRSPSPKRSRALHRSYSRSPVGGAGKQLSPSMSPSRHTGAMDRGRKRYELSRSPDGRYSSRGDESRKHHEKSRSSRGEERRRHKDRTRSRSGSRSRSRSRSKSRTPAGRSGRYRRSRSRSPAERSYYSRARYSPRRRSPPSGYRSRRDRPPPRRRPWSPPPNRDTGIGKPGNNLFVAGFSSATNERELERKFSKYGRVSDVRIVRDRWSGDSRGFGFLSLERDEDADAAIKALDQTEWNGRIVLVEKARTSN